MHYSNDALDHTPTFNIAVRLGQALASGYKTLSASLFLCCQAEPDGDPAEIDT